MRKTYVTAGVIALVTVVWLLSGQLGDSNADVRHPTVAELKEQNVAVVDDKARTRVRARHIRASTVAETITVRGRTENKRTVLVRSELAGRVVARPIERGDRVAKGDLLCRLADDDRPVRVAEAGEALKQARIDYQGRLRLQSQGFQSESETAQARAMLASAQARLTTARLNVERTMIRAPFDGVVETTDVELGDYVQPGAACATIVDLDPMLLVGRVSERDVHRLRVGSMAEGVLPTGTPVRGPISFVGQQAEPTTRTYAIEITIPNADHSLRSGVTARIDVSVATVLAHKVSPALLALDDAGGVGVRTTDADNRVQFHTVEIVADDADGVWVTGLPEYTTLITVGQEFVTAGETVDVVLEDDGTALAPVGIAGEDGDESTAGTAAELARGTTS